MTNAMPMPSDNTFRAVFALEAEIRDLESAIADDRCTLRADACDENRSGSMLVALASDIARNEKRLAALRETLTVIAN